MSFNPEKNDYMPTWLEPSLFEPVLRQICSDFQQTKNFKVTKALRAGENYFTVMLRLEVDIELTDGSTKALSLMLKIAHDTEIYRELMKSNNVFDVEATMYGEVVPELEQMYKDVGVEVKFGAKSYQLSTQQPYILLEDLRPAGFINVDRLEGLDIEHTHCVLKKLAQWHAASAVRVATRGDFKADISAGFIKEDNKDLMESMMSSFSPILMDCVKTYNGHELYYERMCERKRHRLAELYAAAKVDSTEFNVLNHGDCWVNNIMFKHDAFGKVEETYLVDYQAPRYGSPAHDLYYLLLSSTNYELKISKFDYFIRYYHDHLLEYLKMLNYTKTLPTLIDIHINLHKYSAWAFAAFTGVMPAVLLDPHDDAQIDNFIANNDAAIDLKTQMYSNARFRKHSEILLPWMYNRGAV